jgi:hypothetical protein
MRKLLAGSVAAALVGTVFGFVTMIPRTRTASAQLADDQQVRVQKIQELYGSLVAPMAQAIMTGQVSVSHIFDSTVKGRVTPAGQFLEYQEVLEYFYGLAATPSSYVYYVDFKSLVASGEKVAVEVDIYFNGMNNPIAPRNFILTETGFFTFNAANKVVSFDLAILNLGAAVDPRSREESELNIKGTCALLTLGVGGLPATCPAEFTGAVPVAKYEDCLRFMHGISYGSWNRANSNTFVCRQLHSILTIYQPGLHCSHVSKSGGGVCVDFPYESYYQSDF